MRIDALTLSALAAEWRTTLYGGRIDTIVAPTPQSIALQCYANGRNSWIEISAHPQFGALMTLDRKPAKMEIEPSSFVMLLRKYLEGGRIDRVEWVRWERIVEIGVRHGDGSRVDLIAEIMGKLSNILLVNDQRMILGVIHPVSLAVNHYRALIPGKPYLPPPAQTRAIGELRVPRLDPASLSGLDLTEASANSSPDESLWRTLLTHVAGMSQDLAQETVCRAAINEDLQNRDLSPAQASALAAILHDISRQSEQNIWDPTGMLDDEGTLLDGWILPPCRPMPKGTVHRYDSVHALVRAFIGQKAWKNSLDAVRIPLRKSLKTLFDREQRKIAILQQEMAEMQKSSRLREEGELLLAFAHDIPADATTYTTPDMGTGDPPRIITLDPRLTAIENANARFAKYHKHRRAMELVPSQIARAEVAAAHGAQLLTDLEIAETVAEIGLVREEMVEDRLDPNIELDKKTLKKQAKAKNKKGGKQDKGKHAGGQPLIVQSSDGMTLYVGKNSRQNDYVTFEVATGSDIWLHARGIPGAHVIIKTQGRAISQQTLQEAAQFAAWYSQSRGAQTVPIDYTEQRNVRRIPHSSPGMVTYVKEHTLHAVPKPRQ